MHIFWICKCSENCDYCLTGFCSCKTSIHYVPVNKRFPKKHNLVLFGQRDLLHCLSLNVNKDIKSRITYSANIKRQNDDDMERYIVKELEAVRMGVNTFNEGAMELIIRSAQGNLRLCRNLCYGSLIDAAREAQRSVTIAHVNSVLVQPHWRSHEELIKQQVS